MNADYKCITCGKIFSAYRKNAKYCSSKCYGKSLVGKAFHVSEKVKVTCACCEGEMYLTPSAAKKRKYCSPECQRLVSREKHPLWRGGLWLDHGYVRLKDDNGKKRYLHDVIWEELYGPIPAGYLVHHKDRDKQNNNFMNLELRTVSSHTKEHALEWRRKERERRSVGVYSPFSCG